MMKNLNSYIKTAALFITMAAVSISCKKEMIKLNTNPTVVGDVAPEYLFSGYTADFNSSQQLNLISNGNTSYGIAYFLMTYMQYIVPDGINADLISPYWGAQQQLEAVTKITHINLVILITTITMARVCT